MKIINRHATSAIVAACIMAAGTGYAHAGAHAAKATENASLAQTLASQYGTMAAEEQIERDSADEAHFGAKSARAAAGEAVGPDLPSSRTLGSADATYAETTHRRILAAYEGGAANTHPIELGTAQASYDCWIQEAEEGYQLLHMSRCRDAAEAALAVIETPPAMAKTETVTPKPTQPAPPQEFVIYFGFDSSDLDSQAIAAIDGIVTSFNDGGGRDVNVIGHTDTSGSSTYNLALSQRRAEAVTSALNVRGIPVRAVDEAAVGEIVPAVDTGDGVREPRNRRVVVTVNKR